MYICTLQYNGIIILDHINLEENPIYLLNFPFHIFEQTPIILKQQNISEFFKSYSEVFQGI